MLKIEMLRMLRNKRFVVLSIVVPVALYLLFSKVWGGQGEPASLMVSMAAYGALAAAMMTTSVPWAQERTGGWIRQLRITPLRMWSVIVVKLAAAMLLVLPALLAVSVLAGATQNVSMPPGRWAAVIAAMWLGALPFAAFGLVVGSLATPDSAQPITALSMLAFALLGGLLMPLEALPAGMRGLGRALPSNAYGELGREIAAGHPPVAGTVVQLAAWAAGLAVLAVVAFGRATVNTR